MHNLIRVLFLNSFLFPTVNAEHIASTGIYINAVSAWIVFCKYCSHRIESPYHSINDPTSFIRYMLQAILACYTEFEERVGLMTERGNGSTAYDIVKRYTEEKIGKYTGADVVAHCPSIGRSSALAALKKLTEEGLIIR